VSAQSELEEMEEWKSEKPKAKTYQGLLQVVKYTGQE